MEQEKMNQPNRSVASDTEQSGANIPTNGSHHAANSIERRLAKQRAFIARKAELRKDARNCTRCCKPKGDSPTKLCPTCREYHARRLRIKRMKERAETRGVREAKREDAHRSLKAEVKSLRSRVAKLERMQARIFDYSRERYAAGVKFGARIGKTRGLVAALNIVKAEPVNNAEPADMSFNELAAMSHKYVRARA